jgi:hypothetical protein
MLGEQLDELRAPRGVGRERCALSQVMPLERCALAQVILVLAASPLERPRGAARPVRGGGWSASACRRAAPARERCAQKWGSASEPRWFKGRER